MMLAIRLTEGAEPIELGLWAGELDKRVKALEDSVLNERGCYHNFEEIFCKGFPVIPRVWVCKKCRFSTMTNPAKLGK